MGAEAVIAFVPTASIHAQHFRVSHRPLIVSIPAIISIATVAMNAIHAEDLFDVRPAAGATGRFAGIYSSMSTFSKRCEPKGSIT